MTDLEAIIAIVRCEIQRKDPEYWDLDLNAEALDWIIRETLYTFIREGREQGWLHARAAFAEMFDHLEILTPRLVSRTVWHYRGTQDGPALTMWLGGTVVSVREDGVYVTLSTGPRMLRPGDRVGWVDETLIVMSDECCRLLYLSKKVGKMSSAEEEVSGS